MVNLVDVPGYARPTSASRRDPLVGRDELGREIRMARNGVRYLATDIAPVVSGGAGGRGAVYNLLDNIIGYDDDVVTPGERLKSGVQSFVGGLLSDPLGTGADIARGGYETVEGAMGPSATPIDVLGAAGMAMGAGGLAARPAGSVGVGGRVASGDFGENWSNVYHWTRSFRPFDQFDPDISTSAMSQLGPHVGTRAAAEARATSFPKQYGEGEMMELRADVRRPFLNPRTNEPWSETGLEAFISQFADEHGIDRRKAAPLMRRMLANEGFTDIPYINDIEDAGSTSNIMLVDRPSGSDAVLRRTDAKFDPAHRADPNLLAANRSTTTGLLAASAADTPAQQVARLLREGRGAEVTDDLYAAADPQELHQLYTSGGTGADMPMDTPSRMARADAQGYGGGLYHGTTHDFDAFGGETRNLEGHFGAGHYLTDSAQDASDNYAGYGPDLTQRIDLEAERLAIDMDLDYDDPVVRTMAREKIAGPHEGAIIPAMVRGNTVDTTPHTRGRPTTLENTQRYTADDFMDDAIAELGDDADKWDLRSRADEIAWEANADSEPEGPLADFVNSVRGQAWEYDFDADEALMPIREEMLDGFIDANRLDSAMRQGEGLVYAEGPNSELVGNDVIRQAFQDAGFPNIRMSANAQGWNMPIPERTSHVIASDPSAIRSRFARFDPRLAHLSNLNAANVDPTLGLLATQAGTEQDPLANLRNYVAQYGLLAQ